jgi:hypothetical protein
MAAMTTAGTGDWSSTTVGSPWTALTGAGPGGTPGSGDTVTITKAITISTNQTVGTSPATGGTAAITCSTGWSIAHTGGTLTLLGDVKLSATGTWTMSAGAAISYTVATGVQYKWNTTAGNAYLVCNGTSGSHCTFGAALTGTGSVLFTPSTGNNAQGLITATYTDFSNIGTSSAYGIRVQQDGTAQQAISITNCTFTGCSLELLSGANTSQTSSITFTNNKFSSSVTNTVFGTGPSCCCFDLYSNTTITCTVSLCSFDATFTAVSVTSTNFALHDNYMGGQVGLKQSGTTAFSVDTQCYNNIILMNQSIPMDPWIGNIKNCYLVQSGGSYEIMGLRAGGSLNGLVFENTYASNSGGGGAVVIADSVSGAQTITIQNCLCLPTSGTNFSAGYVHFDGGTGSTTLNMNHNTWHSAQCCLKAPYSTNLAAGQVGSFKANLFWASTKISQTSYKSIDEVHPITGGVSDVFSPTAADYNASYKMYTDEPSTFTSNTYTFAGDGYQGNHSAYPGAHDLADQDPQFVDNTRNLSKWGGTTAGGGTATNAAALAVLAANPALISQATTGLLAWVKAGFAPQNANLEAASYPSDPSTVDSAGNAWPGAGPGIGAMGFFSTATAGLPACYPDGSSVGTPRRQPALDAVVFSAIFD